MGLLERGPLRESCLAFHSSPNIFRTPSSDKRYSLVLHNIESLFFSKTSFRFPTRLTTWTTMWHHWSSRFSLWRFQQSSILGRRYSAGCRANSEVCPFLQLADVVSALHFASLITWLRMPRRSLKASSSSVSRRPPPPPTPHPLGFTHHPWHNNRCLLNFTGAALKQRHSKWKGRELRPSPISSVMQSSRTSQKFPFLQLPLLFDGIFQIDIWGGEWTHSCAVEMSGRCLVLHELIRNRTSARATNLAYLRWPANWRKVRLWRVEEQD